SAASVRRYITATSADPGRPRLSTSPHPRRKRYFDPRFYATAPPGLLDLRRSGRIPVLRRGGLIDCATCTAEEMWVNLTAGPLPRAAECPMAEPESPQVRRDRVSSVGAAALVCLATPTVALLVHDVPGGDAARRAVLWLVGGAAAGAIVPFLF